MSDEASRGDEGRQFCMMCGAPNPVWARYCRTCGADLTATVESQGLIAEEVVTAEEPSFTAFLRWLFNPSFAILPKILAFGNQTVMALWSLWFTGRIFLSLLREDPLAIGCFLWFFFPLVLLPTYWFLQSMALLYGVWSKEVRWPWLARLFASLGILIGSNLLWYVWGYGLVWVVSR